MKKGTKRWLSGLAIALGAAGAAGAFWLRRNMTTSARGERREGDVWARPGMRVTFRAEVMPGRDSEDRTFKVKELLPSGRVSLHDFEGEHTENEFESIGF
jgi:hypothetical protein